MLAFSNYNVSVSICNTPNRGERLRYIIHKFPQIFEKYPNKNILFKPLPIFYQTQQKISFSESYEALDFSIGLRLQFMIDYISFEQKLKQISLKKSKLFAFSLSLYLSLFIVPTCTQLSLDHEKCSKYVNYGVS